MKTLWKVAAVTCVIFIASCSSVEKKAKDYTEQAYKAALAGDKKTHDKIQKEMSQYYNDLSKEVQASFSKAADEKLKDLSENK